MMALERSWSSIRLPACNASFLALKIHQGSGSSPCRRDAIVQGGAPRVVSRAADSRVAETTSGLIARLGELKARAARCVLAVVETTITGDLRDASQAGLHRVRRRTTRRLHPLGQRRYRSEICPRLEIPHRISSPSTRVTTRPKASTSPSISARARSPASRGSRPVPIRSASSTSIRCPLPRPEPGQGHQWRLDGL